MYSYKYENFSLRSAGTKTETKNKTQSNMEIVISICIILDN